jgi:hypothetical protein
MTFLTWFATSPLASQAKAKAFKAEATAKADARTSALAKLSALGLTPQEIEAL